MLKIAHNGNGTTHQRNFNGWKKQRVDRRDDAYALKLHGALIGRPSAFDNRPICSAIEDQGAIGSCTAQMFAALIESNEIKRLSPKAAAATPIVQVGSITTDSRGTITFTTKVTPSTPAPTPAPAPPAPAPPAPAKLIQVSRLFEYYATRKIEGTINEDSGATIRDAIKCGSVYGIADEATWPYDVTKFALNPPQTVWTTAASHKVTSYHAISDGDLETMKTALSQRFLIGFGFTVYDSFLTAETARTGIMPMPDPAEQIQGGHAVALVGYNDAQKLFLARNSWGTSWGQAGYFWLPYAFVADTTRCSDFWVVAS